MSLSRLRYFVPHRGRMTECSEQTATKLAKAPRTGWRPPPILVGTIDGVSMVYVRTARGQVRCEVMTGQARKCAEAAAWVTAVHAFMWLGNAAIAEPKAAA